MIHEKLILKMFPNAGYVRAGLNVISPINQELVMIIQIMTFSNLLTCVLTLITINQT